MTQRPILTYNGTTTPLFLHNIPKYLPTAYNESMSLIQKINKVIRHLDEIGEISNGLVSQWNDVMFWIINDGLTQSVVKRLNDWLEDGTLETIINDEIFGDIKRQLAEQNKTIQSVIKSLNDENVFVGLNAGKYAFENHIKGVSSGNYSNVAIGMDALLQNFRGWKNTVIGHSAMKDNKGGYNNVAIGDSALEHNIGENGQVGTDARDEGSRNTAVGSYAGRYNKSGRGNTLMGRNAGHANESGNYNTAIGTNAYSGSVQDGNNINAKSADFNTAVGYNALFSTNAPDNVGIGHHTGYRNVTGHSNVYIGANAGRDGYDSNRCVGVGFEALNNKNLGHDNVAIGARSMANFHEVNSSTAIGDNSLLFDIEGNPLLKGEYMIGIGKQSRASGDLQVQLGTSGQTTYAYGAVQNRSDERDKTDIVNTQLGLEFIKRLRAVDFRWNYRDDYVEFYDEIEQQEVFNEITQQNEIQDVLVTKSRKKPNDGSMKRTRKHHGVIAQEVRKVMEDMQVEFGGFQDHSLNGGNDVLSIGYEEFIAPLIQATQELSTELDEEKDKNVALELRVKAIEDKLLEV